MTRQMPYEPLPASVLFGLGFADMNSIGKASHADIWYIILWLATDPAW